MAMDLRTEKVAVLGPSPTFSSLAAQEMCENILIDSSFGSIRDVVRAVSCGQALIGVVPVRNSSVGEVADTSAALGEHPEVAVLLRRKIPINLSLLAQDGVKPSDIRTVISKGQALLQCREWIRSNLPGAQLIEAGSTSEGMERALTDRSVALIGSSVLTENGSLRVVVGDIQDNPGNSTEFAVVVRPDVFGVPEDW